MIEMPPEKSPEKITRRPGFGVSVMRGLMTLSRLYTRYGRSGYIPLADLHGTDRGDIRAAMRYIRRLSAWHFWKRIEK